MLKNVIIVAILLIMNSQILAEMRSGAYLGFRYENLSHNDPYIKFTGPLYEPTNFQHFEDNTTSLYLPFGWSGYGQGGFGDVHSAAFDMLFQGLLPLDGGEAPVTGATQISSGSNPVLQDYHDNIEAHPITNETIDYTYWETDLIRAVYAGNFLLPGDFAGLLYGFQVGVGKFGISGHKIKNEDKSSPWEPDFGTVSFNDGTDMYYGWNTGFSIFPREMAMYLSYQYDYHFFIGGMDGDEFQRVGNRTLIEATIFPFPSGAVMDLAFRFGYRSNTVPYMKDFMDWTEENISYSNEGISFGFQFYVL